MLNFQTVRHNWHVHVYRTANATPSTMCNGVIGGHFNPFNVDVGSSIEMQVCNETTGTRYQLRYYGMMLGNCCHLNVELLTGVSWVT